MAIYTRNGKVYLYRNVRQGGRIRRLYLDAGELAEYGDALIRLQRAERQAQADKVRRQRQAWANDDALIDRLDEVVQVLVRSALLAGGYHQHARGQWRRRRHGNDDKGESRPGPRR